MLACLLSVAARDDLLRRARLLSLIPKMKTRLTAVILGLSIVTTAQSTLTPCGIRMETPPSPGRLDLHCPSARLKGKPAQLLLALLALLTPQGAQIQALALVRVLVLWVLVPLLRVLVLVLLPLLALLSQLLLRVQETPHRSPLLMACPWGWDLQVPSLRLMPLA